MSVNGHRGRRNVFDRSLAKKRKLCGLTQHQVAQLANVSVKRIVFAETGRIDLMPDEMDRVKKVLRERVREARAAVA